MSSGMRHFRSAQTIALRCSKSPLACVGLTVTWRGTRSLYNSAPRTLMFALLADGVPADKVCPFDLDRAFKKLDQIKPHIKVWWTQGNQSQQLIRDGEIDIMALDVRLPWSGFRLP
jgi:hypothetical protein